MIFKESPYLIFEKQNSVGFIETSIGELEIGDIIKVSPLDAKKFEYQKNKVNYSFELFCIITRYVGLDGIYRIGVMECLSI